MVGWQRFLRPLASLEVSGWQRFLKTLASLEVIGWQRCFQPLATLELLGLTRFLEPDWLARIWPFKAFFRDFWPLMTFFDLETNFCEKLSPRASFWGIICLLLAMSEIWPLMTPNLKFDLKPKFFSLELCLSLTNEADLRPETKG